MTRWDLARQLLVENETIVRLDLKELAGGDADLLTRLEFLCLYPLLPDSELETLLVEQGAAHRASWRVPFDMIAHRRPVSTPVKGVYAWVLTRRVPLSLGFASIDK